MKANKFFSISCMMLFSALAVVSCTQDDGLSTDSLNSGETTLAAYGPNPALRGQKLTFAGTHLDKITKVVLPENVEITEIEVVSDKVIKVVVPQEAKPGTVRLAGNGGIEIVAADLLQISEPVSITKMSPSPVKAGQTLTIEGDYFNLITKVILMDKVEIAVSDLKTYSRTKMELVLPAEAQTGVVTLADDAEIPLEYQSPDALQVTLPSVSAVKDLTGVKPGTEVTVEGANLDLVVKVEMPGGAEVEYEVEGAKLTFTLPDDVSDGVIVMLPASGVRVPIATVGVAEPENVVVTPATGLRGGDEITVTGKNLELVTTVVFPGVSDAVTPTSKTATELKVVVPAMTVSGDLILNTASGKSVAVAVETLKPVFGAYAPSPASAGASLKITGSNLDLAVSVTFADNLSVEVSPASATELTVDVPKNAVSGTLLITMANGETVTFDELEITAPAYCYILNPPGPKAEIHAGGVLTVEVANGAKLADVQVNGVSVTFIHNEPYLYAVIPGNAKGDCELKLISENGEAVYTIPVIGSGDIETVIHNELTEISWGNPIRLYKESFESLPAGAILKFYIASAPAGAQLAVQDANWTKLFIDDPNYSVYEVIEIPEGSTSYEIILTNDILQTILSVADGWSETAMILAGQNLIVSKISTVVKGTAVETTIWEDTPVDFAGWSNTLRIYKEMLESARAGTVMKLYYTATGSGPQFAMQDANWAKVAIPDDPNFSADWGTVSVPADGSSYEIVLTQDILDVIMGVEDGWSTTAIIFGGQDMAISKVTLL